MADTLFANGTVIQPAWLNDVNNNIYDGHTAPAGTFRNTLSNPTGSNIVGFLPLGTGAVSTTVQAKLRQLVSVKDFGAVGDGVADDTAAFQAAITYAQTTGARGVFINSHGSGLFYKITAPLIISRPIEILGESTNTTLIGIGFTATQHLIDIDGTIAPNLENVSIGNFTLRMSGTMANLMRLNNVSNAKFHDLQLYNGRHGLVITGNRNFSNLYERIYCSTKLTESAVLFDVFTGGGQHTFVGCNFYGKYGVQLTSNSIISTLSFLGCNFEQCDNAFYSEGDIQGIAFHGTRFEKNGVIASINFAPLVGKVVSGVSICGCFFETDGEVYTVQFTGAGTVRGFHIQGNYARDYSTSFVRCNGVGDGGVVSGNYIDNMTAIINANRASVEVVNNYNSTTFLGAKFNPPLVTPTLNAAATDLPTVIALTNQIRLALINAGLAQ